MNDIQKAQIEKAQAIADIIVGTAKAFAHMAAINFPRKRIFPKRNGYRLNRKYRRELKAAYFMYQEQSMFNIELIRSMPIPEYASGGVNPHPGGAAIVGEQGKEIITPKQ